MSDRKRCGFMDWLRAHVALEALRGAGTIREIAARHQVTPAQVRRWKRRAVRRLPDVFADGAGDPVMAGIRLLPRGGGRLTAANDNLPLGRRDVRRDGRNDGRRDSRCGRP